MVRMVLLPGEAGNPSYVGDAAQASSAEDFADCCSNVIKLNPVFQSMFRCVVNIEAIVLIAEVYHRGPGSGGGSNVFRIAKGDKRTGP